MTLEEIIAELQQFGNAATKKTFMNHGAKEPFFGVKVADLKKIQKKTKQNHELALALYDTGISDAMYLAGLVAEPAKMTAKQLNHWVKTAPWYMVSEYTVAWVAAESNHGWELAMKWIDNKQESVASSGWSTLASIVSIKPDDELDVTALKNLLKRVEKDIHQSANRVRYTMNGFVIAVGSYVAGLTKEAKATANRIGKVEVDMGGTACKVPPADMYIDKVAAKGYIGKKRKRAVC